MAASKWRAARPGEGIYRFLAMTKAWFPDVLVLLARLLGPRVVGRINLHLPPVTIDRLSRKLPSSLIAEVVLSAARPLPAGKAYVEAAQFAALLSRANLKQLVVQLNDLPGVAQITGHLPAEKIAEVRLAFSPQMGAKLIDEMLAQGFGGVISRVQAQFSGQRRRQLLDELGAAARRLFPEGPPAAP